MNLNARSKLLIQNGDGNNLITTVTSTVYSYKCGNTHNAKVAFTSGFIFALNYDKSRYWYQDVYAKDIFSTWMIFSEYSKARSLCLKFPMLLNSFTVGKNVQSCELYNNMYMYNIYMCVWVLNIGNNYTYALNIYAQAVT